MKKGILKKDIDRLKKEKLRENGRTFPPANEMPRESRFKRTYSLSSNEKTPV